MCGGKGVCLGVGWEVRGVICSTVLAYMGPIIGRSCHKYHFCGDKSFVVANDEHMFVVTKHVFCHDRRCVLSQQTHVCYDKHEFVTTKVLLRQRWYLWRLPPMIEDQVSMWRLLHEVLMYGGKGVCVWGGGGGEGRGAWGDLSNSAGIYMGTRFDVLMCVCGGGGGGGLFATAWGESVRHLTNSAVIHRISCMGIVSENTNFCTIKTDFLWREKVYVGLWCK